MRLLSGQLLCVKSDAIWIVLAHNFLDFDPVSGAYLKLEDSFIFTFGYLTYDNASSSAADLLKNGLCVRNFPLTIVLVFYFALV